MKPMQLITDRMAIGLSLACVIHCLALPIVLVAIPNFLAIYVDSEYFHLWMVFAAIPISIYALNLGCKDHKHKEFIFIGVTGLCLLYTSPSPRDS